jgi:hypothetical protein
MDISLRYYKNPGDDRARKIGIKNVKSYRFDGEKIFIEFVDRYDDTLIHIGYYQIEGLNTIKHRGT